MNFLPMIFVLGPSGAGKSEVSKWIEKDLQLLHLDIDIHRPFRTYRLQREWDQFSRQDDPMPLVSELCRRIDDASHSGVLFSFPSTRILTRVQINLAKSVGIRTVILWGPKKLCKRAACERLNGPVLDGKRYDRSNRKVFDTYGDSEYADLRVDTFCQDGSRLSREDIMKIIHSRVYS